MRSGLSRTLSFAIALAVLSATGSVSGAERNTPGAFDYYALVLSWNPSYCRDEGRDRKDRQCDLSKSYGFLLHGLWPQYEVGWPNDCPTGGRPFVPQSVITEMSDIMPSRNLVIHEYRSHGTCSGLAPRQYFAVARELYQRISVPARFAAAEANTIASPEDIEAAFVGANPWLKPKMISVTCRNARLFDVRICFDRNLVPRACTVNEDQGRLCPLPKITVPAPGG
jgi:ribonuclease T2